MARVGRWLTSVTSVAALRKRELLADYTAVMLTRDPAALVHALRKMADSPQRMADIHRDLVNLYIVDPADPTSEGSGWRRSHPSAGQPHRHAGAAGRGLVRRRSTAVSISRTPDRQALTVALVGVVPLRSLTDQGHCSPDVIEC